MGSLPIYERGGYGMSSAQAFYFLLHSSMSHSKYSWKREYLKLTLGGKRDRLESVVEYEDKTIYRPTQLAFGLPYGCQRITKLDYTQALLRFRKDSTARKLLADQEKAARKLADKKLNGIRGLGPAPAPAAMRVAPTPEPTTDLFGDFTIIDTEYQGDFLLELAAIRYKNWQEVDRYESFVRFTDWLWPKTTELTTITESQVRRATPETAVLQKFITLAGDSLLIAHNVGADRSKLQHACLRQGREMLPNKWFCTLQLARARSAKGAKCGLTELCDRLKFSNKGAHRAMSDVERTYKVLRHFHELETLRSLDPKAKAAAQSQLFAA
ncbi:3'-5' exonuclease [Hymenobacter cheonanensis]|uniref:3'-5' exonuclease n=1 Tax=Hymenobacter sp. CA2-7 TaxID=3063993 RepID=UPI002714229E|nr:3'-5' exonuclease [Hymenobacter sp. CA2-7]MDO7887967.1 3'-5' exonuclease [Hymenobacter sp. CA2-7]